MLNVTLNDVKNALGIPGDFQDDTIKVYFDEVVDFLKNAGVADKDITAGVVSRGVVDLWNYGSGEGKLSEYFTMRAIQLLYKK